MAGLSGSQMAKPKSVTLKYFAISGRAEPIRLVLTLGKIEFNDMRIQACEWEAKFKSLMPFGQLPVLVVDQRPIAQTKTILRYLGKGTTYGGSLLYPQDPVLAARVDEIMDAFDDLWIMVAPTMRIQGTDQKVEARRNLFSPGGPAYGMLDTFEKILLESTNGYVVPQAGLTLADLMYFCTLNTIRSGFFEGLGADIYKDHKKLMQHKEKIAAIPEILKYYEGAQEPCYEVFKPGK